MHPMNAENLPTHQPLSLPADVAELVVIKSVAITTDQTRTLAADTLARASTKRKQVQDAQKEACAAVVQQLRDLKAQKDALSEPYEFQIGALLEVEAYCKAELSKYDMRQLREAEALQAKANAEAAKLNAKIEARAEAKGLEPVYVAPPIVQAPPKIVQTDTGSVSRKRILVWSIKGLRPDEQKKSLTTYDIPASDSRLADVPREFLILNVAKLNKERSMGRTIPGLLCTEELDYGTRRKD